MTPHSKSSLVKFILGLFFLLVLGVVIFSKNVLSSAFKINEISFNKNGGNDWVEIYNPSFSARNLKGMYLTDNKADFTRFEITQDLVVPAGGFVVLYGENYEDTLDDENLRLNFSLKNGETVYLLDENQRLVDSLTAIDTADVDEKKTVGRFPDGDNETFTMSLPTPGASNQKDFTFINPVKL